MKLLCCLALLVALASGCDSQAQEPDTAEAMEDAAVLALRYQLAIERDSVTVELPEALVREFAEAIARVRASEHGGLVEDVHAVPPYVLRDVIVSVDTSASWIVALRRGDASSGEPRVDRLLRDYGLALAEIDVYSSLRYASALFQSERPLNPVALARRFASAPGVRLATPNTLVGGSRNIMAERDGRGWKLTFSRGSGDCPAGCISRTFWDYRVVEITVEYLGMR